MDLPQEIIKYLYEHNPKDQDQLGTFVRRKAGEYKQPPVPKSKLLEAYRTLVKNGSLPENPELAKLLTKRGIRTASGVAPITIMTAPLGCPSNCLYCPTEKNMPKSYLSNQPAAMRAVLSNFHPFKQTAVRMRALHDNGHRTDKIEIIINGGTWSAHPPQYQGWFIKNIFDVANSYTDNLSVAKHNIHDGTAQKLIKANLANLDLGEAKQFLGRDDTEIMTEVTQAQKINETADNRIIGITFETRPDHITNKELARMRQLGGTKIEIGVQNIYNDVLELNRRGHGIETVIRATKLMKDAGFKVAYHIMPGMYGSTVAKDIAMFKELFSNEDFQPDFLKIYPCVVVEQSDLYELFEKGDYIPYSNEDLMNLMIEIKKFIPPYTRIARLFRDIPSQSIKGGHKTINLRELIHKELQKLGIECQCIRCREPMRKKKLSDTIEFNDIKLRASGADEHFLSFDSPDKSTLFAFLRLRLPEFDSQLKDSDGKSLQDYMPDLENAAIIREIHTYGQMLPLSYREKNAVQHAGLGKKLMAAAEDIARQRGYTRMAVIAGVGVREYYRKLGYKLGHTYMIKDL